MQTPLKGIKVVEISTHAFGPAAAGILADMGADVIKIEPPAGDPIRGLGIGGAKPGGLAFSWENYNRGKRSLALDLKQPAALDIVYRLIEGADVFLTNFLPRTRSKLKIDIDDLRAKNQQLIYAIGSGTGRRGPEGGKGGYDAISFWARGGIAAAMGSEGGAPPSPPGGAFGDTLSAAMLAGGVCAAIAQRALSGHASVVDASLLGTAIWAMQRATTFAAMENVRSVPGLPKRGMSPLVAIYKTKDGRFLSLCMLEGQKYWPPFCAVAGRNDLAEDPRFATEAARQANLSEGYRLMDELFASMTLAQWQERLLKQDGQWDVVQDAGELQDDPQVIANEYLQAVDYGDGRVMKMVSAPMQFDGQALKAGPAPGLGQHSEQILANLDFDKDAIAKLRQDKVVF